MNSTLPYWLVLGSPHALVQGGVSVPQDLVGPLSALFDHHHRVLGRSEPVVSGWLFRPANLPAISAVQACQGAPFSEMVGKQNLLWDVARDVDHSAEASSAPELWNLSYVCRDRRTSCATPQSIGLFAPREDPLLIHRFFREFSSVGASAMAAKSGNAIAYGWTMDRQMDDPFAAPQEIIHRLRHKLEVLLRGAGKKFESNQWARLDAAASDIEALCLQGSTSPPRSSAGASRL